MGAPSDGIDGLSKPALIFTHGARGTLESDDVANFAEGFVEHLPLRCFEGNMNLKSRVKMFSAVINDQLFSISLGCRSTGARAAIMAATQQTKNLVLVSYPLHTDKEMRGQNFLGIDLSVKVIFVSGDRDKMCELERLEKARKKMRCQTWKIVIEDADQGMNLKPKKLTDAVGTKIGEVVTQWIVTNDDTCREARLSS